MANTTLERPIRIAFLVAVLFGFQCAVGKTGHLVAGLFDYSRIDPYNAFGANCVHHLVMLALSLAVIVTLSKTTPLNFHFGTGNVALGKKFTWIFTAACAVVAIGTHIMMKFNGNLPIYGFPLQGDTIAGTLGFQLLLTGPAEEILYRMLPIPLFVWAVESEHKSFIKIPYAVLLAALIFASAHMKWSFLPLGVQAEPFAVLYAFAMGIIQGYAYYRCRSIIYPILMHSLSNVLMVGTGYVCIALFS